MENSPSDNPEIEAKEQIQGQRDLMKALVFCVVAVILVRSFILEPFRIPSSSMVPTLKIGDHIFVSKFDYGFSVPFTKIEFLSWSSPKRGDVIVFLWPRDESLHYVKRVVGIPGDLIEINGKEVTINAKLVTKDLVTDEIQLEKVLESANIDGELYQENLAGVTHYLKHSSQDVMGVGRRKFSETVPSNMYFVMGDNRDDSSDSRSWGFVPRENIKGKARFIWLSIDQESQWGSSKKVRWNRAAQAIK